MTADRKRRLRQKIRASRERLLTSHPSLAILLMYLRFVATPHVRKISTNGRCIFFSADYLDKLYHTEVDFLLCHQILHIVFMHVWRPAERAGDRYHHACDIVVNACLEFLGFTRVEYPHLGKPRRRLHEGDTRILMTPDTIFEQLNARSFDADGHAVNSRLMLDEDTFWDDTEENGDIGEIILDLPEIECLTPGIKKPTPKGGDGGGRGDGDDLRSAWQDRGAAIKQEIEAAQEGKRGGGTTELIERLLDKKRKPQVDWRRVLNAFVQESVCDYSFAPPDRRFAETDFFLPDLNEREFVTKEILFMADTSGSVGNGDLGRVYAELRGAIEQFGGKICGKLGFFDTRVTKPLPFEAVGDLSRIRPYGGGGTDFRVIFDYLYEERRNDLPACLVIFTDGYGPYPDEADTLRVPVLWIINNQRSTPPFGKVTRLLGSTLYEN